jgi:hypothetical protein
MLFLSCAKLLCQVIFAVGRPCLARNFNRFRRRFKENGPDDSGFVASWPGDGVKCRLATTGPVPTAASRRGDRSSATGTEIKLEVVSEFVPERGLSPIRSGWIGWNRCELRQLALRFSARNSSYDTTRQDARLTSAGVGAFFTGQQMPNHENQK